MEPTKKFIGDVWSKVNILIEYFRCEDSFKMLDCVGLTEPDNQYNHMFNITAAGLDNCWVGGWSNR